LTGEYFGGITKRKSEGVTDKQRRKNHSLSIQTIKMNSSIRQLKQQKKEGYDVVIVMDTPIDARYIST